MRTTSSRQSIVGAADLVRGQLCEAHPLDDLHMTAVSEAHVALSDPPRPDSAALVAELGDLGIRTVMMTGDGPATAQAIGAAVR